jgi:nucleoside 2-deoxyribosyltransferase-like protein
MVEQRRPSIEFTDFNAKPLRGYAFVVMQFSGFDELYTDVIDPLTRQFGLHPYRADLVYGPGAIMDDIIKGLEKAQIVIAEITPANENVFYEVGYAHALKKPTILLAEKDKKLPFDLSGFRCLFYENSIGGKRKVEEGLRKHLEAIFSE